MSSRGGRDNGVIGAYQKYKTDARGWGVPDFKNFRGRLWPLRNQRDRAKWPDDDMVLVMQLQEDGAGRALQRFFASNPVAVEILGEKVLQPEAMARDELDAHMKALIRDCKASKWSPGEFGAFIDYLDSDKTPADLDPVGVEQAPAETRFATFCVDDGLGQAQRGEHGQPVRWM